MPNDDLNVKIVGTDGPLPVEFKAPALRVVANETFPVEVVGQKETEDGLPPALRRGIIHIQHGKKTADIYKVQKVYGLWAHLIPLTPEGEPDEENAPGWWYLPSIAAGPWREDMPELKTGKGAKADKE